jgi:hypothetical protein
MSQFTFAAVVVVVDVALAVGSALADELTQGAGVEPVEALPDGSALAVVALAHGPRWCRR